MAESIAHAPRVTQDQSLSVCIVNMNGVNEKVQIATCNRESATFRDTFKKEAAEDKLKAMCQTRTRWKSLSASDHKLVFETACVIK